MRNPKWHRDEIILALDLYFQPDRGSIDNKNPKIVALSSELNQLPIFIDKPDATRFRNPNGVSLKLSNFQAIDPNYTGKGMVAYSKLDKVLFEEFVNDRKRLHYIAAQIRAVLSNETLRQSISDIEEDEISLFDIAKEGQTLYRFHKYRERNTAIVKAKKKKVLKTTGTLACEVCNFDFYSTYGPLGEGFIECHHTKPLAQYEDTSTTQLEDLALVCANCHRMLHRRFGVMSIEDLKSLILHKVEKRN